MASTRARAWRELDRAQILELRMVKRLVAPAKLVESLLVGHSRGAEYETWREVAAQLP